MRRFFEQVASQQKLKKTFLCVGLDPLVERLPVGSDGKPLEVFHFLSQIVEATKDLVCCYKPQFAHFAAQGLESELKELIGFIKKVSPETPVILDSKRGDIGTTAEMYALEAFQRYGADAVTVNPYMGSETLKPFASYTQKGIFVLCRTSNPGAGEIQNLKPSGSDRSLYYHVAMRAMGELNYNNNIGLVVGATALEELRELRIDFPEAWFLIPGVGFQGGSLESVIEEGCMSLGTGGGIVNASRSILYASHKQDFLDAARNEAIKMQKIMAAYLG